ncbi:hypothetical protein L2E82_44495 [Cichorium intybus]|uniref:Uncharacterized protein n=1 Tax=Cichorium intybus TaxID=13427 RepID=A0ACB8ZRP9_CICIN|nr:hypothetical protein L2E82_44495 [Cichorium intybus]
MLLRHNTQSLKSRFLDFRSSGDGGGSYRRSPVMESCRVSTVLLLPATVAGNGDPNFNISPLLELRFSQTSLIASADSTVSSLLGVATVRLCFSASWISKSSPSIASTGGLLPPFSAQ